MTPTFGRGRFILENWISYSAAVTLWVKNFVEIALSSTVFEIEEFFGEKKSKIQNCRHFWRVKYSLKIFVFCDFCEKFENSKWPPFLAEQNIFDNWISYSAEGPYESKILSKLLYLARFSRYKHF